MWKHERVKGDGSHSRRKYISTLKGVIIVKKYGNCGDGDVTVEHLTTQGGEMCTVFYYIFPPRDLFPGWYLSPGPSQVGPAVIALKKYLSYPCKKLAKIFAQVPRTTTRATPSGKLLSDLVQTWQIVQEKGAFSQASLGPLLRNIFAKKRKETTLRRGPSPPLEIAAARKSLER